MRRKKVEMKQEKEDCKHNWITWHSYLDKNGNEIKFPFDVVPVKKIQHKYCSICKAKKKTTFDL